MVSFTRADNGKTVKLAVGESATIKLAGNPTTGYTWTRAGFEKSAEERLTDGDFSVVRKYVDGRKGVMGGGGEYHFTVTPRVGGKHELKFVYVRSFDATHPAEHFTLHIEV